MDDSLIMILCGWVLHPLVQFGPNMFGMFQIKGMGFQQIQRKKRLDRALQLVCIGTLLIGVGVGVKSIIRFLSQATGQRQSVIFMGMFLSAAAAMTIIRKTVLSKSKTSIKGASQ
jgi:hypothetical protein